jgi:phosphatidylglycerol:prolipoprotein diacylglycerol transferase
MFIHNINPTIFSIGSLEIRWYGLVYVIGFSLVYYILHKRRKELKLGKEDVDKLMLSIILGTVIGARLFMLIWEPAYYFANPLRIFAVWQGGMSLHGGIAGIIAAGYWFCKRHKIKFLKLADIVVVPALIGLALGRVANFINAELVGTVTNVRWCVDFGDGACRHPVQLYGALGRFVLFGFLFSLDKIKKYKDGFLFWSFVLLMGIGRFVIDFFRQDVRYFGLSLGQYLSLVLVIAGAYVLIKYYKKAMKFW